MEFGWYGLDMTKPGAQSYYDSIMRLYAGWGVDYYGRVAIWAV